MKQEVEEKYWYAVYTAPKSEKKIADRFHKAAIEYYLPVQKRLKQWSDRKKWIEEPLFKSYIFVNISEKDYYNVLNTYGVVRFITFSGRAVKIPQREIGIIRHLLAEFPSDLEVVEQYIMPGTPIEIIAGPMMGISGELVQYKGERRAAVRVEYINQSVLINIPHHFIKPIKEERYQYAEV